MPTKTKDWKIENLGMLAKYKHVFNGLAFGLHERSTQIDLVIVITGVILSLLFAPNIVNKGLLIAVLLIFLAIEYMNTAVETTVDRVGLGYHILSKHAKDLGAASAFLITLAIYTLIILTTIHIVIYYRKWRKQNPNGSVWDYIKSTWN